MLGDGANFIVKENGLCIAPINDDEMESWKDDKTKIFSNGPIPSGSIMHYENGTIMFAVGRSIYKISKK